MQLKIQNRVTPGDSLVLAASVMSDFNRLGR